MAEAGWFRAPGLDDIERSFALALTHAGGRARIFLDLWDIERFASCGDCLAARRDRLHLMNLEQRAGRTAPVPGDRSRGRSMTALLPIERIDADIAIVGSGFAGALAALALRRRGRRVVLIERGRHPRFVIGESSTPLCNLLLEELADRYDLPRVRPFSKWGTWQRARPEVACGLKRGFTFFFHQPGSPFPEDADHQRQLLVAASPNDEIADTHWYRPELDQALVEEAQAEGAIYLDLTRVTSFHQEGETTVLSAEREGRSVRIGARFVIDASGPRGFLHHALGLEESSRRWLPPTQGLYTHFESVERWDRLRSTPEAPPYPIDDAAVHHVFPGGWIWVLRFNNGLTSAGAALTDPAAAALNAAEGAPAWDRLMAMLPSVADQFRPARATLPFVHAPRLSFRSARVAGSSWAMLPSAAGVIDPLLSTGFPLTLLGLLRLLDLLERSPAGPEREAALREYERTTLAELDATEQLVAALYETMTDPPLFKRLSLLYFAAASFSETVQTPRPPAAGPRLPAARASDVRCGIGGVRGAGGLGFARRRP